MTLREAIEEVKRDSDGAAYLTERGILYVVKTPVMRTAIATILNAVVKGELVAKTEPRKSILNRYAMQNGHTKEQRPDESREDYNLRVYGLREEDME